jgi:hypothetical protein
LLSQPGSDFIDHSRFSDSDLISVFTGNGLKTTERLAYFRTFLKLIAGPELFINCVTGKGWLTRPLSTDSFE